MLLPIGAGLSFFMHADRPFLKPRAVTDAVPRSA
jgi:hypothetical protein